jgi:TRAP-type uncharacterized transport system substrate-binding protein
VRTKKEGGDPDKPETPYKINQGGIIFLIAIAGLCLGLTFFALSPMSAGAAGMMKFPKHAIIGTFPGSTLAVTQGLTNFVQKEMGISSVPHTGRSSIQELKLLSQNEVDMTMCSGDIVMAAFNGAGLYKEKGRQPIRLLTIAFI